MIEETAYLGACPVITDDGIYLEGKRVIRLGLQGVGLGDIGDLLAYRQEWSPFVEAHLNLWREMNELFESAPEASKCPDGIFDSSAIQELPPVTRSFCAALVLTRMYTSATHSSGILTQWNAWQGKSSADILAAADIMLAWHQDVVLRIGDSYTKSLVEIARMWDLSVDLPPVPSFSTQQRVIANIEGAYVTAKGVLGIIGYGIGETFKLAASPVQALSEGLTETAKELPKVTSTIRWVPIAVGVTAVLAGAALITYYVPRHSAR